MPSTREDLTSSIEGKKGGSCKDYVSDLKEGMGAHDCYAGTGKAKAGGSLVSRPAQAAQKALSQKQNKSHKTRY